MLDKICLDWIQKGLPEADEGAPKVHAVCELSGGQTSVTLRPLLPNNYPLAKAVFGVLGGKRPSAFACLPESTHPEMAIWREIAQLWLVVARAGR